MLESVLQIIKSQNMIQQGEKVAVACSGGMDSMCLLHYLNSIKDQIGFSLCAITVDHQLRDNSSEDSQFVVNYCKANDITVYKYSVNAKQLAEDKKISTELAAREARYGIFNAFLRKNIAQKIALAHHQGDQAETILLNLFRGAGITGARGMELVRDGQYIRPLLKTSRMDIKLYLAEYDIPYVTDQTNLSNEYSRNYIRNMIMPLIRNRWKNVDSNICAFGELARQDDEYIEKLVDDQSVIYQDESTARIPLYYFSKDDVILNRLMRKVLKKIGCLIDVEKKHLRIIKGLALEGVNGNKINLPNKLVAIKEYNYLTITNKELAKNKEEYPFIRGRIDFKNYGVIEAFLTRKLQLDQYTHLIDYQKLPKDAVWRTRKDKDMFTKFGGGTKSLNEFLIDKKVPVRYRDIIPVLASGNEILVVAGVEISDRVKIDENTKTAIGINCTQF